uniref:Cilia- and flagella-associated protein 36 n=1 Tax=Alexandrium catenella TaxID=2925 RepID=A0A7S1SB51_ALECA|mmetsp:Transcript_9132/g.24758  ORF Transcript_9132/g.24758 Transcript_9132/m.24758 type:complete len:128 (+) Transcript_9132:49-432(+)
MADSASGTSGIADEKLLSLVDRLTDDRFLKFLEGFIEENAQYFVTEGDEQRHYYQEIHTKYQRFFESRAEAWLREQGESPEGLLSAAVEGGLARDVAEELLAVSDYGAFVAMMQSRRAALASEAKGD